MAQFIRIEARIADRDELKMVALRLGTLANRLEAIANGTHDDEAAMLLARDRIKSTSQIMRKGLKHD